MQRSILALHFLVHNTSFLQVYTLIKVTPWKLGYQNARNKDSKMTYSDTLLVDVEAPTPSPVFAFSVLVSAEFLSSSLVLPPSTSSGSESTTSFLLDLVLVKLILWCLVKWSLQLVVLPLQMTSCSQSLQMALCGFNSDWVKYFQTIKRFALRGRFALKQK